MGPTRAASKTGFGVPKPTAIRSRRPLTEQHSSMFKAVDVTAPAEARIGRRGMHALVGVVLQGGLRFASVFIVGRMTNPATLAHVSSGLSVANVLALAWPTTQGAAASRFIARARGEGADPNTIARAMSVRLLQAVSLLSLLAIPIWLVLGGTPEEAILVAMLTATYSVYTFTRGVHLGAGQSRRQVRWDLLTSTVAIFGVVAVLMSPLPAIWVLGSLSFGYALYSLACFPWSARGRVSRDLRREIDAFVAWGSLGTVASAGFVQFAMIVAIAVAGREEAGQFAASMALAAPAAMIANSLAQVLYPSMAEAFGRGDLEHVRMQLDVSTQTLVAVMVAIYGLLIVGARPVVDIVWGSQYAGAAAVIPFLLIPNMLRSIAAASVTAVSSSSGGIAYSTKSSLVGLLIGVLIWSGSAEAWGVIGVGFGYAVGTTFIAASIYVRAWRTFQQSWTSRTTVIVSVTVLMAALSWGQVATDTGLVAGAVLATSFVAVWCVLQATAIATAAKVLFRR